MKRIFALLLLIMLLLLGGCSSEVDLKSDGSGSVRLGVPLEGASAAETIARVKDRIDRYNTSEGVVRFRVKTAAEAEGAAVFDIAFTNVRFLKNLSKILGSVNAEFYFDNYESLLRYNYNDILTVTDISSGQVVDKDQIRSPDKLSALIVKRLDITGVEYVLVNLPGKVRYISASNVEVIDSDTVKIYGKETTLGVIAEDGSISAESRILVDKAIILIDGQSNFWKIAGIVAGIIGAGVVTFLILKRRGVFRNFNRSKNWAFVKANYQTYTMLIPGFVIMLIFCYLPMAGLIMIFKEYNPKYGIFGSEFVWLKNLTDLFRYPGFERMVRNTVSIAALKFVTGFPACVIFALLLNELRTGAFKRVVQTISYLPHFISWMIISGMMFSLLAVDDGMINKLIIRLGGDPVFWYSAPEKWWGIFAISSLWKGLGWGTVVYLAALANISPELYEAAKLDGASRFQLARYVSLPGMMPIVSISFIFGLGGLIKDDFEQIYALVGDNHILNERAEVFSTWIFRQVKGTSSSYGVASMLGFLQGIITLLLMVFANKLVKKKNYPGLW